MNSRVVCMVRGGEAGRKVQRQAINYALNKNFPLVFLHIIYLGGLSDKEEALLESARMEMTWLARVTLNLARTRASRAGIQAEIAIRNGPILETTIAFLRESPVDRIFIGSPDEGAPGYLENSARLREFATRISEATGVPVSIGGEE